MTSNTRSDAPFSTHGTGTGKARSLYAITVLVCCLVTFAVAANQSAQQCAPNDGSNTADPLVTPAEGGLAACAKDEGPVDDTNDTPPDNDDNESAFIIRLLQPGEITPIMWRKEQQPADPYARFIGLPPILTDEIRHYCDEVGLTELFYSLAHGNLVEEEDYKLFTLKGGEKWIAKRPGQESNWATCNIHWVDVADEENFEATMNLLKRGDFDVVLDAIGNEFDSDSLMIAGMGFIVVSHCDAGDFHRDDTGSEEYFFDMLFPLILPENDTAELLIGDMPRNKFAPVQYRPDVAVLMSGDTVHATGDCDYRDTGEIRVAVSVYVADIIDEDVADIVSGDYTALFPVPEENDWLWAQKGRFWGGGNSMKNYPGRLPFSIEDDDPIACPTLAAKGECETDLHGTRLDCLKSCNVYIEDERYYSDFVLLPSDDPNSHFAIRELQPGELTPLIWRKDKTPADPYARLVGLPPQLTEEIHEFCEEAGLIDFFHSLAYSDLVPRGKFELFTLKGGRKWIAKRPGKRSHWKDCNIHWVDVADEENFEETMLVLGDGDFDVVLDAIGREFESDGLMIAGMGFIVVSHCSKGSFHKDDTGSKEDFFDLLFPLILPKNDTAELLIGDLPLKKSAPVQYRPNVGVLMSGDTYHATEDCDYREAGDLRVAVSVYVADINEDVVDIIAADGTALFPVPKQTDWLWTQKGRFWGGGNSLKSNPGRMPFSIEDKDPVACPTLAAKGGCETDPFGTRLDCLKSCNVYIEDERYYSEFVMLPSDDVDSMFAIRELQPGELSPITWRKEKTPADPYARFVGLPPKLTEEIRAFCEEAGLIDFFYSLAYSDRLPENDFALFTLEDNRKWIAKRPGKHTHWEDCHLYWVDVADEENFEETMQVLGRGDFDVVLDAIGNEFKSESLMIAGMGFIVVSQCSESRVHMDDPGSEEDFFDLLFPLILPTNDTAELLIGDEDLDLLAPVKYRHNVGILMSGDTFHATEDCDYREAGGLRVAVSVYVADINDSVVDIVAGDNTALFPVPKKTDWLWAQKGRFWGKGSSLKNDKGRKPFRVEDEDPVTCPALAAEGKCETDLYGVRMKCLKSCKVYTDDERYFSKFD